MGKDETGGGDESQDKISDQGWDRQVGKGGGQVSWDERWASKDERQAGE